MWAWPRRMLSTFRELHRGVALVDVDLGKESGSSELRHFLTADPAGWHDEWAVAVAISEIPRDSGG